MTTRKSLDELLAAINRGCRDEEVRDWLLSSESTVELEEFVRRVGSGYPMQGLAISRLGVLHIKQGPPPHWTVKPSFFLLIASLLISLVALFLAWRADQKASSPGGSSSTAPTHLQASPSP